MEERRSSRPKRDVAYASFAGEDSVDDEDFVIVKAQPKIEKKSISKNKLQEECDLNLKKEHKGKKIQENVCTKKQEPKKRLPLDEKLLMRDIQKAVEISRSQSSLEDGGGDDDDDASNPIKTDVTKDVIIIKPSAQHQPNNHHQEQHDHHHQELSTPTTNAIADSLSLPSSTSTNPVALPTISSLSTITTTTTEPANPVFLATISINPVTTTTTTMEKTNQIARKQVADRTKTSKKRSHQSDDDEEDDYSDDDDGDDDDDYSTSKANNKKKQEDKVQKVKPQNPKVTKKVAKSSAKAPCTTTAPPLVTASSSSPLVAASSSSLPPAAPKVIPSLTPSISQSNKFASSTPRSSTLRLGLSRKSRVTSLHPSK